MKKTSWMSKIASTFTAGAAALMLFAGFASAHVTVNPSVAQTGAWQTYTIKIPSEKEIATTKIALKIPEGVSFKQYQPLAGWKVTTEKNDSNEVTMVTWEVDGNNEGILAGQFQQFNFVAQNTDSEAEVAWDAFQYYSDGSIVEWTGGSDADYPHSITTITANPEGASSAADSHGHDSSGTAGTETGASADNSTVASETSDTASDSSTLKLQQATLIVSILALVLSFLGIALATRRKKR